MSSPHFNNHHPNSTGNYSTNTNGSSLSSPVEYLSRILAPPLPPILAASVSRGSSLGITPKADYRLFESSTSTGHDESVLGSSSSYPYPSNAIPISNTATTTPYSLYSPPLLHQNSTTSIVRAPSIHEFILGDRVPDRDHVHGSTSFWPRDVDNDEHEPSSVRRLTMYPGTTVTENTDHDSSFYASISPLFRSPRPTSIPMGTTITTNTHHIRSGSSTLSSFQSSTNLPVLPASTSTSSTRVHGGLSSSSSPSSSLQVEGRPLSTTLPSSSDGASTALLPPSSLITVPTTSLPVKKILFSPKLINFLKWGNTDRENEETVRKRAIILHALQTPVMIPPTLQNRMPGIITNTPLVPEEESNNSRMDGNTIMDNHNVPTSVLPLSTTSTPTLSTTTTAPTLSTISSSLPSSPPPPVHSVVLWNRPRSHSFAGTSLREDNLITQYREGIELKKLVLATAKIRTKQEAKISTLVSLLTFESTLVLGYILFRALGCGVLHWQCLEKPFQNHWDDITQLAAIGGVVFGTGPTIISGIFFPSLLSFIGAMFTFGALGESPFLLVSLNSAATWQPPAIYVYLVAILLVIVMISYSLWASTSRYDTFVTFSIMTGMIILYSSAAGVAYAAGLTNVSFHPHHFMIAWHLSLLFRNRSDGPSVLIRWILLGVCVQGIAAYSPASILSDGQSCN